MCIFNTVVDTVKTKEKQEMWIFNRKNSCKTNVEKFILFQFDCLKVSKFNSVDTRMATTVVDLVCEHVIA